MRSKQLEKGIRQLTEEGVAQLFTQQPGNKKIVGCVGELQFEVIRYRLEHEYGADCAFQAMRRTRPAGSPAPTLPALAEFIRMKAQQIVQDKDGQPGVHGAFRLHAGPGAAQQSRMPTCLNGQTGQAGTSSKDR
jgi:peptide chain release factor 3